MVKLDTIIAQWETDCVIDMLGLDDASRKSPVLHAKYLDLMAQAKLEMRDAEFKQKVLMKDKWLWFHGKLCQEKMEKLGWDPDPFNGLKVLKGDMHNFVEADPDLIASEAKIHYHKTVIETLKEIVDNIKWRHMHIKNIIENKKFEAGF